jgi:hypothetical protein
VSAVRNEDATEEWSGFSYLDDFWSGITESLGDMKRLLFVLALGVQVCFAGSESPLFPSTTTDPVGDVLRAEGARTREQAREIAMKEQQFVQSFNRLANALDAFSKTYKSTHTIDVRKVKAIKDAYRRLEQSDTWFRPE